MIWVTRAPEGNPESLAAVEEAKWKIGIDAVSHRPGFDALALLACPGPSAI